MTAPRITKGALVVITDAHSVEHCATAMSGVVRGRDFPVVWVDVPRHDGQAGEPVPWPAESVRLAEDVMP